MITNKFFPHEKHVNGLFFHQKSFLLMMIMKMGFDSANILCSNSILCSTSNFHYKQSETT